MYKAALRKRRVRYNDYDLYDDIEKIKSAFTDAGFNATHRVGEVVLDKLQALKNTTTNTQDNITHFIVKKPIKAIGLGFLAGVVIGFLIHR